MALWSIVSKHEDPLQHAAAIAPVSWMHDLRLEPGNHDLNVESSCSICLTAAVDVGLVEMLLLLVLV